MTESPEPPPPTEITVLLQAVRGGGVAAQEELVQAVYHELKRLAGARLRGQQPGQTIGPTALVHEAWLRLGLDAGQFEDRRHFFGAAARAMRQVLVDRYRHHHRAKRAHEIADGADVAAIAASTGLPPADLVALDEALHELEAVDARMAQIVQLRFFAGLSVEETAAALEISERTVKREWSVARAWLFQRLDGGQPA